MEVVRFSDVVIVFRGLPEQLLVELLDENLPGHLLPEIRNVRRGEAEGGIAAETLRELAGEDPTVVPVVLLRHVPVREGSVEGLQLGPVLLQMLLLQEVLKSLEALGVRRRLGRPV